MPTEVTKIMELVDKNIKTVIITIFHVFKRTEKKMYILSRDKETIENSPN